MIVRVAPPEHYGWIAQRTGVRPGPEYRALEALRADGSVAGMIGFDSWTPASVTVDIALDAPIALRPLIEAAAVMAFKVCGRDIVRAVIRSDNQRSLRLAAAVGFRQVYRDRDGWARGVDLVVFRMERQECRWLRQRRKAA